MSGLGQLQIEIDVIREDDLKIARIRPQGEIDLANADELAGAISSPECAACAGLLLDLQELEFMDSSGLREMLVAAQSAGASFATVVKEGSAVATLFEMVDVSDRLNVAPNDGAALAAIRAGADAPD